MSAYVIHDNAVLKTEVKPVGDGRFSAKLNPGRGRPRLFNADQVYKTVKQADKALAALGVVSSPTPAEVDASY